MGGWKSSIGTLLCAGALLVVGSAGASEKPVAEKILDILKANGQISQEQYDDLSRQTKEEAKTQPAAKHHGKGVPLEMSWNKGLRLTDPDGNFKFKIGGRIMNDWAWFNKSGDIQNTKGDFGDGTEFRRARLYLAGTVNDRIGFKAQYDFAGGDADFKDVYIELKKVPYLGHIRVGHFKEAYSLEELTSSKYITFMERSIADVAPGRNTGIGFYNSIGKAKRATWAVGAFREAGGYGNSSDENAYNVTGRVTGLPWYEDRGAKLLHLGFSYSHKFGDASTHQLEQKPEAHMAKALIDTGTLLFDDIDLLTPEVVLVLGPFSLQGEYTMTSVSRARGSADVDFDSYYVEASYFLTGEHREYKTSAGAFSRVPPKTNFGKNGGCGAWQLAVRYSAADYNDADIAGGKLENVTVGLNWHLNPNARLMFNYTNSNLNNVGDVDIAQMRFQIDF